MSKLMLGIVCGVSVLFVAAVLPRAQDDGTSGALAPPAGNAAAQDASSGAPAGTQAPAVLHPPGTIAGGAPLATFVLSGSGKLIHLEGPEVAGASPFKSSLNSDLVTACINGTDPTCTGDIETDAGGKSYLLFDSLTSWRIATNPAGDDATTFTGQVDGKGGFTMAGTHALSSSQIMLTGKVKFEKGTLNPVSLSGKIIAVSTETEHYGTGSLKGALYVAPL